MMKGFAALVPKSTSETVPKLETPLVMSKYLQLNLESISVSIKPSSPGDLRIAELTPSAHTAGILPKFFCCSAKKLAPEVFEFCHQYPFGCPVTLLSPGYDPT